MLEHIRLQNKDLRLEIKLLKFQCDNLNINNNCDVSDKGGTFIEFMNANFVKYNIVG